MPAFRPTKPAILRVAGRPTLLSRGTMLVLNVTTNFQHMHHIIELVNELTGDRGSPYLLFKTMPQFGKYLRIPPVTKELLTVPWHRAKFEPFHINKGQ